MEAEKLRIYDKHGTARGIATRQDVHKQGYWHKTFHCWMMRREKGKDLIYLQLRSEDKKDFPSLFDITAAGHLLAHETVQDGVREVQEELGINVKFEELISLGTIKDQLLLPDFIDNEQCYCFLYRKKENSNETFELQLEEVSGIVTVEFEELAALFKKEKERIEVDEIIHQSTSRPSFSKWIGLKDFVPHSQAYLEEIIERIRWTL